MSKARELSQLGDKIDIDDTTGDFAVDTDTLYVDVSDDRVGIGTSSPSGKLDILTGTTGNVLIDAEGGSNFHAKIVNDAGDLHLGSRSTSADTYLTSQRGILFKAGSSETERMRIDSSSGDVYVGKTSGGLGNQGAELNASGQIKGTAANQVVQYLNRTSSDGSILEFRKDNSTVGSIGAVGGDVFIGTSDTNFRFADNLNAILPVGTNGATRDNAIDLGSSSNRFDDIYATNGTIQTSDANEKQDVAELDEAEKRVAVAAKGLIRKYRWIDAVAEKGDDARIHVGIIAQDLQAAFTAEGLDASRYAMFISTTWWEATETYTDDDGVEQTRVNTYETAEEAPEGATERTRLGVRYPELLAFIIGAM